MEQSGTEGRRSKYRGICWDKKHNGWRVTIFYAGKQRHVGRYADEVAAARAYDKAAVYLYGSHAITNFGLQACLEDPTEVKHCIVLTKMLAQASPAQNSPAQGTSQQAAGQSSSSSMQPATQPIADSSIAQSHIEHPPGLYSPAQLDSYSFPDQQRAGSYSSSTGGTTSALTPASLQGVQMLQLGSSSSTLGRAVGFGLAGAGSHTFSPPGVPLMHLQQEQQQLQQQQGPHPMQLLQQQHQIPVGLAGLVQQPSPLFTGTLQHLGPHYYAQPQQQLPSSTLQLQSPHLMQPRPLFVPQQQQLQLQSGLQQPLVQIPELSPSMDPTTPIPGLQFLGPAPSNVQTLQAFSQGQPGAHISPVEGLMPQWTTPELQAAGFSVQNPEALLLQQPTIISSSARPLHAAAQQQIQTSQHAAQEAHAQLRFPWER